MYARGSTLAATFYQECLFAYSVSGDWQLGFGNHTASDSFQAEYIPTGSGDGKSSIVAGTVDFAGSDSPYSPQQIASTPDLIQIPAVAASIVMIYNIPEVKAQRGAGVLVLSQRVLVDIFSGNITMWSVRRGNPLGFGLAVLLVIFLCRGSASIVL